MSDEPTWKETAENLRETVERLTRERDAADHDADFAKCEQGKACMDNAELRVTIERLQAVVAAADAMRHAFSETVDAEGTDDETIAAYDAARKACS